MRKFTYLLTILMGLYAHIALANHMPVKGELMSQILKHFGEPQSKTEPVGKPPITTWEYEKFTVYFEGERVIHTIEKKVAK